MASLATSLAPGLLAGGTVMSATGYMDAAKATQLQAERRTQAAQFAATQLEQQAGQETAAGQAAAAEQLRQGKIVGSNILARVAAGGGGASDPGIATLIARNAGESSYRAALASYQGLAAARQSRIAASGQIYGAQLTQADADAAAAALRGRAASSVLTGAGSLFNKYWSGTPNTDFGTGKEFGNLDYGSFF